jgi:hypothetical protein
VSLPGFEPGTLDPESRVLPTEISWLDKVHACPIKVIRSRYVFTLRSWSKEVIRCFITQYNDEVLLFKDL